MKPSIDAQIAQYVTAWNEKEPAVIKATLAQSLHASCTYEDKNTPLIKGLDAFTNFIAGSYNVLPERHFSVASAVDFFHYCGMYHWQISIPGKESRIFKDFFEFDDDHKITRIVGFV